MKLIFKAKKDNISGIIEIVKLVKTGVVELTATCVDNSTIVFCNDCDIDDFYDCLKESEKFDKMCEEIYFNLSNTDTAKFTVDYCSLGEYFINNLENNDDE